MFPLSNLMKIVTLLGITIFISYGHVLAFDTTSPAVPTPTADSINAGDSNRVSAATDSVETQSIVTSSEETASCPVSLLLSSDDGEEEIFTRFRDVVLAKHERGITYTKLYYIHSPEITLIILTDNAIKAHAQKILSDLLPIAAERLKKGESSLPQKMLDDMDSLINEIARSASPALKDALRMAKSDLIKKTIFEELKISTVQ